MSRDIDMYAPPLSWGPWMTIAEAGGSTRYLIECTPSGNTQIYGMVKYFKDRDDSAPVEETFIGSTQIITPAQCMQAIELCLKGNPFGSHVRVTVNP